MLLEVKDITVHYHKVAAIKKISITVEEGSIVTLIGANGAGKSTTLRAISGLNHPSTGEIWFNGKRIDRLPPEKVNKVGIAQVPEGRRVFPYMTVFENLEMGFWGIVDDEGRKWLPVNMPEQLKVPGARVRIRARPSDMESLQMWGTAIEIVSFHTVPLFK